MPFDKKAYNREWMREHGRRHPRTVEQNRAMQLRTHRLSIADYNAMLAAQKGLCAICKDRPLSRLCVDHDHATGKVRGLLCGGCNKALGLFKDNLLVLAEATRYLEQSRQ